VQGIEAGRIPTQVTSLIEVDALPAQRSPPLAGAPPAVPMRVFALSPGITLAPAPSSAVGATCTLSCCLSLLQLLLLCMRTLWTWGS
jgi:hypothetical protein